MAYASPMKIANGLVLDFTVDNADTAADTFLGLNANGEVTQFASVPRARVSGGGNLTEATSSVLTITGGSASVLTSGLTIQVKQASGAQAGYLSSADWTTFNNKLGTSLTSAYVYVGNGSNVATGVAISGDITISNAGVVAIASGVIVNADINASAAIAVSKLEALTASRVLGSDGSGVIQALNTATYPSLTELAYVKGVTSAIQTQLNNRLSVTLTSPTNGDVITYNGSAWVNSPSSTGVPTGGTTAQILRKIDNTNYNTEWHTLVAADITDVSSTAAELNKLSGVTTTATQFNFLNTLSGDVQAQLAAKLSTSLTQNYMIVGDASNIAVPLAPGTNGYVLTSVSGVPTWVSPGVGGTVTSVAASGGTTGMSFTGSPITTTGTLTLTGTLIVANGGTGLTALGTANQLIRVNAGATALEYFTPSTDFADNVFRISDNSDSTKKIAFEASGISAGTVRTFTAPNSSGTLALTSDLSGWLTGTLTGNVSILGGGTRNLSLGTIGSKINDFLVTADNSVSLNSDLVLDLNATGNLGVYSGAVLGLGGSTSVDFLTPLINVNTDAIIFTPYIGSSVDITFAADSQVTGGSPLTFRDGKLALRNVANTFSGFFTNTVTANRTYTLPNASGTVALTSDIVTYTSSNGITKTGSNFTLGGTLTGATSVYGSQNLSFGQFGGYLTQFNVASDTIDLRMGDSGGSGFRLQVSGSDAVFTDNTGGAGGLRYAADYSAHAGITNRHIPDRGWVSDNFWNLNSTSTLLGNTIINFGGFGLTFDSGDSFDVTVDTTASLTASNGTDNTFVDVAITGLSLQADNATNTASITITPTTFKFIKDTAPSVGDVWTASNIDGTGYWAAPSGGGYTNLTQFVSQTNWRTFYSNGSGDVTELAFGAYGTALKSNSTTSAPAFDYLNPVVTRSLTANNYTLQDIDNGCIVELDNGATAGTITLPTGLPASWNCTVVNRGTGILTLTPSGSTLTSDGTTLEVRYTGVTIYSRGSNAFTAVGALGSPLTLTNITGVLPVASGGTNISSYAIGDLLQATGATTLSKLASVSAGSFLRSGGVTTASAWSTVKLPDTMSALGLWVANSANTTVNLTAAAGQSIRVNAGGTAWEAYTPGGGGIGGSTGATDNLILRSDGTGGSTLQNSSVSIDDSANMTLGISSLAGSTRTFGVDGSATDIGLTLYTKGAGSLEIGAGNASLTRINHGDAATSTATRMLSLTKRTSGTAAAGFGLNQTWDIESGSGNLATAVGFTATWSVATDALETSSYVLATRKAGASFDAFSINGDNMALLSGVPANWQSMQRGVYLPNRTAAPTTGIANGVALFAEDTNSSSELYTMPESGAKVNISGLLEPVTESGTSFSLNETHRNKIVLCTNSGAITVTVGTGKAAGWNCLLLATHATGTITLSASGTTLNGTTVTTTQFETLSLVHYGSENYLSKLG